MWKYLYSGFSGQSVSLTSSIPYTINEWRQSEWKISIFLWEITFGAYSLKRDEQPLEHHYSGFLSSGVSLRFIQIIKIFFCILIGNLLMRFKGKNRMSMLFSVVSEITRFIFFTPSSSLEGAQIVLMNVIRSMHHWSFVKCWKFFMPVGGYRTIIS